ncbi:hypothetical protein NMY22_g19253 [Coprinellus aureogranulatus]|nr:hypothetical protein NMY22_g19253 [Coprinellus aureogranulatus]
MIETQYGKIEARSPALAEASSHWANVMTAQTQERYEKHPHWIQYTLVVPLHPDRTGAVPGPSRAVASSAPSFPKPRSYRSDLLVGYLEAPLIASWNMKDAKTKHTDRAVIRRPTRKTCAPCFRSKTGCSYANPKVKVESGEDNGDLKKGDSTGKGKSARRQGKKTKQEHTGGVTNEEVAGESGKSKGIEDSKGDEQRTATSKTPEDAGGPTAKNSEADVGKAVRGEAGVREGTQTKSMSVGVIRGNGRRDRQPRRRVKSGGDDVGVANMDVDADERSDEGLEEGSDEESDEESGEELDEDFDESDEPMDVDPNSTTHVVRVARTQSVERVLRRVRPAFPGEYLVPDLESTVERLAEARQFDYGRLGDIYGEVRVIERVQNTYMEDMEIVKRKIAVLEDQREDGGPDYSQRLVELEGKVKDSHDKVSKDVGEKLEASRRQVQQLLEESRREDGRPDLGRRIRELEVKVDEEHGRLSEEFGKKIDMVHEEVRKHLEEANKKIEQFRPNVQADSSLLDKVTEVERSLESRMTGLERKVLQTASPAPSAKLSLESVGAIIKAALDGYRGEVTEAVWDAVTEANKRAEELTQQRWQAMRREIQEDFSTAISAILGQRAVAGSAGGVPPSEMGVLVVSVIPDAHFAELTRDAIKGSASGEYDFPSDIPNALSTISLHSAKSAYIARGARSPNPTPEPEQPLLFPPVPRRTHLYHFSHMSNSYAGNYDGVVPGRTRSTGSIPQTSTPIRSAPNTGFELDSETTSMFQEDGGNRLEAFGHGLGLGGSGDTAMMPEMSMFTTATTGSTVLGDISAVDASFAGDGSHQEVMLDGVSMASDLGVPMP